MFLSCWQREIDPPSKRINTRGCAFSVGRHLRVTGSIQVPRPPPNHFDVSHPQREPPRESSHPDGSVWGTRPSYHRHALGKSPSSNHPPQFFYLVSQLWHTVFYLKTLYFVLTKIFTVCIWAKWGLIFRRKLKVSTGWFATKIIFLKFTNFLTFYVAQKLSDFQQSWKDIRFHVNEANDENLRIVSQFVATTFHELRFQSHGFSRRTCSSLTIQYKWAYRYVDDNNPSAKSQRTEFESLWLTGQTSKRVLDPDTKESQDSWLFFIVRVFLSLLYLYWWGNVGIGWKFWSLT